MSKQEDERDTKADRKVSIAVSQESMPDARRKDASLTKENSYDDSSGTSSCSQPKQQASKINPPRIFSNTRRGRRSKVRAGHYSYNSSTASSGGESTPVATECNEGPVAGVTTKPHTHYAPLKLMHSASLNTGSSVDLGKLGNKT